MNNCQQCSKQDKCSSKDYMEYSYVKCESFEDKDTFTGDEAHDGFLMTHMF